MTCATGALVSRTVTQILLGNDFHGPYFSTGALFLSLFFFVKLPKYPYFLCHFFFFLIWRVLWCFHVYKDKNKVPMNKKWVLKSFLSYFYSHLHLYRDSYTLHPSTDRKLMNLGNRYQVPGFLYRYSTSYICKNKISTIFVKKTYVGLPTQHFLSNIQMISQTNFSW